MKIRPLHDRIIVKRLEEERKTASGIVIPDTAAEKPDQGEVLAIGKGKLLEDGKVRPLDLKVGDKILFGKYSGQSVKVKGEELRGSTFAERRNGNAMLIAEMPQVMLHQYRHIFATLSQWRDLDRHDVQTIEEIFAEIARGHARQQPAVSRRDYADVDDG